MLDYITIIANEYRDNADNIVQAVLEEEGLRERIREGRAEKIGTGPRLDSATFPAITAMLRDEQSTEGPSWKDQPFHVNYRSARNSLQASMEAVAPGRAQYVR